MDETSWAQKVHVHRIYHPRYIRRHTIGLSKTNRDSLTVANVIYRGGPIELIFAWMLPHSSTCTSTYTFYVLWLLHICNKTMSYVSLPSVQNRIATIFCVYLILLAFLFMCHVCSKCICVITAMLVVSKWFCLQRSLSLCRVFQFIYCMIRKSKKNAIDLFFSRH